jgi:cyclic pyranopterin phosphate synthase
MGQDNQLTHFDELGASRMVDVGGKQVTTRVARATASIMMQASTWATIRDHAIKKGDVLEVARLAGIMAAKQTSNLIPLCHQLPLDSVKIDFVTPDPGSAADFAPAETSKTEESATVSLEIISTVSVTAKTGVEMEALTAVSIAALTIYDMCKAIDRAMWIEHIELLEKSGGRSGHYIKK